MERYAAAPSSPIPLTWTVAVGDTVAIHYDLNPRIGSVQGRDEFYPYNVRWGIADITAIYKNVATEGGRKLEEGASTSIPSSNHFDEAGHYEMGKCDGFIVQMIYRERN